jgi:hypothetical protein
MAPPPTPCPVPFPVRHRTRCAASTGTRHRPLTAALLVIVALTALLTGCSAGPPNRARLPTLLAAAPVLARAEVSGALSLGRDCGYSATLPAHTDESLWLFCDTPVYARSTHRGHVTWEFQRFIPGSTAAVGAKVPGPGPGISEPGRLTEVGTPRVTGWAPEPAGGPTAPGVLAPFLSAPTGLVTTAGLPCGTDSGSYPASWISGVARVPSSPDLLITFNDYCVLTQPSVFEPEGFGLAEYDPATRTLSNDVTVFDGEPQGPGGTQLALGSPVFSGHYLYLFAPVCAAPAGGRCAGTVVEARVPADPLAWTNPFSYQWLSTGPSGPWTGYPPAATALVAGPGPVGPVDVSDFAASGHRLVLIEETDIEGSFTAYQAPGPGGPWTRLRSGQVACRKLRPGSASFCRAIIGHPELSTGAELVLSYFNPDAGPSGHVMVEGFRW